MNSKLLKKFREIKIFGKINHKKNTYNVANIQPNKGVSWTFEIPAHFSVMKDGFKDDEKENLDNKASAEEIDDKQSQQQLIVRCSLFCHV